MADAATPAAPAMPPIANPLMAAIFDTFAQSNKMIGDNFQQMMERSESFNANLAALDASLVKELPPIQ